MTLLPLLAAAALAASPKPDCLRKENGLLRGSVEEIEACQERAASAWEARRLKAKKPPTSLEKTMLREHQREEIKAFLVRTGAMPAPIKEEREPSSREQAETAAIKARAVAHAEAFPAPDQDKDKKAISDLAKRSRGMAGDGSAGITPAMAADMRATLMKQQGKLSPEMADLLNAVERDGGRLTPETMKKLQNGLRKSKAAGLETGLEPGMEKALLENDFEDDKKYFSPGS